MQVKFDLIINQIQAIMKTKLKLTTLFLLLYSLSWGQSKKDGLGGRHELKLNALSTLGGYFESSYDYILNDESSLGISAGFSFDKDIEYNFMIVPNYRFFFGKKPAAGFFIEANVAIFSQEEQRSSFIGNFSANNGRSHMGLGAGIAIGGKFLSNKKGFIGELFVGGGRNFINKDLIDSGYPRIGISIGKRF